MAKAFTTLLLLPLLVVLLRCGGVVSVAGECNRGTAREGALALRGGNQRTLCSLNNSSRGRRGGAFTSLPLFTAIGGTCGFRVMLMMVNPNNRLGDRVAVAAAELSAVSDAAARRGIGDGGVGLLRAVTTAPASVLESPANNSSAPGDCGGSAA